MSSAAAFDSAVLPRFRRALLAWYRRHARRLPWRETADPYAIWISEIMLQQTTVTAVVPYFERFLSRFPDVHALAAAHEEDVLRLWEGLGYYSRARNIHKAAGEIVRSNAGSFPEAVEHLQSLPGIGRYTAGAIASFAFDRPAPIVEANTLRLYCRLLGYRGDPRSAEGQTLLWSFAEGLLPRRGAGKLNQALMELGATVCTPDEPQCGRCPVRQWCAAAASGTHHEIPRKPPRPAVTELTEIAVAVRKRGRYLLLKRQPGERWAGLWDFVRFGSPTGGGDDCGLRIADCGLKGGKSAIRNSQSAIAGQLRAASNIDVSCLDRLAIFKHTVTRYRITLICYRADWLSGDPVTTGGEFRWAAPREFGPFPLSTTGRRLAKLLERPAES